jgi:hypothetical protein
MKSLFKLTLVATGFLFATLASSSHVKAIAPAPELGGCVETGKCGVTANGTALIGFWREKN